MSLYLDKDFYKNKTISIVGPANYLQKNNFGKAIDDSDIVVRLNKSLDHLNQDLRHNLGSKSDILYHCMQEDSKDSHGSHFGFIKPEFWLKKGIKQVFSLPNSSFNGIASQNQYSPCVKLDNVKNVKRYLPLDMIDYNLYNDLSKRIRCKPNTGIIAIHHLLNLTEQRKCLKIYGFSFLLDGYYDMYKKGLETMKENVGKTYDECVKGFLNSKRHIQSNQWLYIKELLNKDTIEIDPILTRVLEMKSFSIEEFSKINLILKQL